MLSRNHTTDRPRRSWLRSTLLVALTALVVAPLTAYAGDSFSDVPDSNIFHDDIDWMADNGVTAGCGGDRFCPSDTVTREQMSAFMRRLDSQDVFTTPDEVQAAIATGTTGPIDADTLDGQNSTAFATAAAVTALQQQLAALDPVTPIATITITNGIVQNAAWRAPITAAPTAEKVGTVINVTTPGFKLEMLDATDPENGVVCSTVIHNTYIQLAELSTGFRIQFFDGDDGLATDNPSADDVTCIVFDNE